MSVDFELPLRSLLDSFDREGIRYALMGGFALGALGAPRATLDIDFLVHKDDLGLLEKCMQALGYGRRFQSDDITQYRHEAPGVPSVDFVHAFRQASLGMLARAVEKPVFGGSRAVRVLQPEDLIGLKVQAMANDPENRRAKDGADIEALMEIYGPDLDWGRIGEYYRLFSLETELKPLQERYDSAQ